MRSVSVLVALLIGGCSAAPQERPQELLFLAQDDGDLELFVAELGSKAATQLTSNHRDEASPSWSPDGKLIAYASAESNNYDIYTIAPDGSNRRQITRDSGNELQPAWSPDGRELAYLGVREGRMTPLVVNLASGKTRVLGPVTGEANGIYWSPDGKFVAIPERVGHQHKRLLIMPADGSGTGFGVADEAGMEVLRLAWSPDSTRIAFSAFRKPSVDVYVADVTSGLVAQLTDDPSIDTEPVWSPDGLKLAFVSSRDRGTENQLYLMNPDGSDQVRASHSKHEEMDMSWSEDGRYLAFVRYQDRVFRAKVRDLNSSEEFEVYSSGEGLQFSPRFRPQVH
ncbi:MAG: hypothetical protein R3E82_07135 [Pseudomonadales bacterium]